MTSKNTISGMLFSMLALGAAAQNETDALRYSNIGFGGTARYNGMAGAFGALGGDISCMNTNPAGIGRFSKSEFNFSLLYEDINTNTSYFNTTSSSGKGNFNLGSIGFVGTKKLSDYDWKYFQFGFSYNRTNFFHSRALISGVNPISSMADIFRAQANGTTTAELVNYFPNSAELAYQAYLIDPIDSLPTTAEYTDRVPNGISVNQSREITRYGNMSETAMTFAGNYNDKIYVGGSIGIPSTRFRENWTHNETLVDPDSLTSLKDFTYNQNLYTRGVGFNMKLGVIFLPVDWVRVGASIHTPNFLSFSDTWDNSMESNFEGGESYSVAGPSNLYSWRLRTPARYTGSLGVVVMKRAALNVDVEYVDYSSARLRRDWSDVTGYDYSTENNVIQQNYKGCVNIRAGGEIKISPIYLRGGFALYQSPYNTGLTKTDATMQVIAGGLGYRKNGFNIDLGLNIVKFGEDYYPYDPVLLNNDPAKITTSIVRTSVTCGWRF